MFPIVLSPLSPSPVRDLESSSKETKNEAFCETCNRSHLFILRCFLSCWILIFGCLLGTTAWGQTEPRPNAQDWPRFLGADINSTSVEKGILKDWSNGKLKLLWQTELGEGYSMCSVADRSVYQFDKKDGDARLRCLDFDSGDLKWTFKYESNYSDLYGYDAGPRSSPLIDDGRIYLFGVEGMLICVDRDTHQAIWKVDTAKTFGVVQNFFGVASSPVVHEDKLIVMIGGSPPESAKVPPGQLDKVTANGSAVVAFDKFTGDVIYKTGNDLASYASLTWMKNGTAPTLLAWARGSLLGIDPNNGKIEFSFPYRSKKLESVNAMTPISFGDRIFLSECYENGSILLSAQGDKIKTIWKDQGKRVKALQSHWCTPVVADGHLYACSGRNFGSAELRCVEISTGKVKWEQPGFGRCSVLLIDKHLIVLGERGRLALVKATPEKFTLVTERLADEELKLVPNCWSAPVVAGGRLFVRGGRRLACFKLILGK